MHYVVDLNTMTSTFTESLSLREPLGTSLRPQKNTSSALRHSCGWAWVAERREDGTVVKTPWSQHKKWSGADSAGHDRGVDHCGAATTKRILPAEIVEAGTCVQQ